MGASSVAMPVTGKSFRRVTNHLGQPSLLCSIRPW